MVRIKKLMIALLVITSIISCKKEETKPGQASFKVSITDAPGDYEHIYLEVLEVAINNGGWQTITQTQADTFDILDYTNGDKLLLAEGDIDAGSTTEIRLVLGANNWLVLKDGTSHELKVPSGSSSGLKIKLDTKTTQAGQTYYVVLDFDASKSIVKQGNGNYSLKPVIRGYWDEGNGSAEGYAISTGYQVNVHAINNADTLGGTIANATTGYYFIGGLPKGNYSFSYESSNGKDTAVSAIQVIQNQTTVIDTVDLN